MPPLKLGSRFSIRRTRPDFGTSLQTNIGVLGCVSLRKSKILFLNLKESENRFCVSLLNRSIQDLSDHGASKEPKNPLPDWILRFL